MHTGRPTDHSYPRVSTTYTLGHGGLHARHMQLPPGLQAGVWAAVRASVKSQKCKGRPL